MLQKDDLEHPVPEQWRATFTQNADAFAAGDFQLGQCPIKGVQRVDQATAELIAENVAAYGERLAPLDDATWQRSVYRWMDGYWQVLVDLSTHGEPVSDLTLHAKIFEGNDPRLEVYSAHVP